MVQLTALIIRVLLPLAVMAAGGLLLRKRSWPGRMAVMIVLTALFAVAANSVSQALPQLTDEVTLTALDQKNEAGVATEVYLSGYTVDGKAYTAGDDLEILSGKWFWRGNTTYCWRSWTDTRQPDGVTNSITVRMPVGRDRTLEFESGVWRGMVEVSFNGTTQVVDTYTEQLGTVSAQVGQSDASALAAELGRRLAVYAAVLLGLSAAAYTALVWRRESLARFNERHRGVLIFLAIALVQLAFAIRHSGTDGLWVDELIEVGWSVQIPNMFQRAMVDGLPKPISGLLIGLWIAIAPYGERWLLLLPEVVTAIGIFFVGLCGREHKNVRTGVFAELFAAVSGTLLYQCSFEIRSYCLYFAASAAVLYLYLKRYNSPGPAKLRENVALFIALVVFAQSHYYAYVICGALFLFDLTARLVFKVKKISMVPWIILGICSVPIAVIVLKSGFIGGFVAEWMPVPDISAVGNMIDYLLDGSVQLRVLFFLGIALMVGNIVRVIELRADDPSRQERRMERLLVLLLPLYLIVFLVTVLYVYGHINTKAPLWVNRYFCGLQPAMFVLCGYAVNWVCRFVENNSRREGVAAAICCVFIGLLVFPSALTTLESAAERVREPYREAADYLYQDINHVFDDSSVIIDTTANPTSSIGWDRYYITKYGKRDSLNLRSLLLMDQEEILSYDRIYVAYQHDKYTDELTQILDTYYTKISDNTSLKVAIYTRNPV